MTLCGFKRQSVFWFGRAHFQFGHAFEMHVESLAGIGKGFGQMVAAGNDVAEIWEIDGVGRLVGLVGDRKDIASILVMCRRRSSDCTSPKRMFFGNCRIFCKG